MIMKARLALLLCSFITCSLELSAQQGGDSTRYVFGSDKVSGAGGLLMDWSSFPLGDLVCTTMGGGGGLLIDRRFLIGGFGQGIASTFIHQDLTVDGRVYQGTFQMGYGGAWLAYSFLPREPIHPYISCQIGWGAAEWHFDDDDADDDEGTHMPDSIRVPDNMQDQVIVFAPSIGIELNMLRWFRPDVFVGYRMVGGLDLPGTEEKDLDGFMAGINLMFGGFGERRR